MERTTRREFVKSGVRAGASLAAVTALGVPRVLGAAKERIKVGQIGVGHSHASGKMDSLRKLRDDYEVIGVVEPDAELRKKWEDHAAYRGLNWMSEEQLLGTKGLRAVAVETKVADLVPTAARCIDAGIHIHLDKPGGASLAPFAKLLDAATRRNLTVQMGYMFRNNPGFELCFRAVREGWLGRVFEVHGVMSKLDPPAERQRMGVFAGGAMFELGGHLIDALVTVLGKPDKVTPYTRRTRPKDDKLADNQLAVFEYPVATATIRVSLIEVDGGRRRQFVVCGEQGTVEIYPLEAPKVRMTLAAARPGFKRGWQDVELPAMTGRYDGQLAELARIIRGEFKHPYAPAHDLAVQEALLKAAGMDR